MGLRDIKVPNMKFKKMKMDVMEELNEIDYEKLEKKNLKKKRETPYEDMTHYKTVKELSNHHRRNSIWMVCIIHGNAMWSRNCSTNR